MKYLLPLLFILSGCDRNIKAGQCYFNSRYDVAIKVTKVVEYGLFAEEIKRPASAGIFCTNSELKPTVYFDWATFDNYEDLRQVDCEAYEGMKKAATENEQDR